LLVTVFCVVEIQNHATGRRHKIIYQGRKWYCSVECVQQSGGKNIKKEKKGVTGASDL